MVRVHLKDILALVKRLSPRERTVLYIAIFFVGLMSMDLFIISPVFSKIQSLNEEIKERKVIIRRNMTIVSQKDKIVAENAKYASYWDSSKSEEEEITAILKEVESLANSSSVYMADMKPATKKGSGGSKKIIISVECEARMDQIVNFMFALENSPKLLTIEKYELSPKEKEANVAKCSLTLTKVAL